MSKNTAQVYATNPLTNFSATDVVYVAQSDTTDAAISAKSAGLAGNYVATAINYTMLLTDRVIGVTNTAAPRTISLIATMPPSGFIYTIKDESGGAGTNNITISGNGHTIDGASTQVISTNYGSLAVYSNGSNWLLIDNPSAQSGSFLINDGTVSAPSLAFLTSTGTGIYKKGSNDLGIACGGVLSLDVSNISAKCTVPFITATGSAASPGLTISSVTNGFYAPAANQVALTINASQMWNQTGSSLTFNSNNSLIFNGPLLFTSSVSVGGSGTLSIPSGEIMTVISNVAGLTLQLPPASSVLNQFFYFKRINAMGLLQINSSDGSTIDGAATYTVTNTAYAWVILYCTSNQFLIVGTGG